MLYSFTFEDATEHKGTVSGSMRRVYSRILLRYYHMKKSFGLKQAMFVEKKPSVLGYPRKISIPLNLAYHTICKFKSKEDAIQRPSRDGSQIGRSIASVKTFINTDQDPESWDTDHIHLKLPHLAPLSGSSAPTLVENHINLVSRCLDLVARCNAGMNIMMNRSVVLGSRQALEQTYRVKKHTLLATFLIPLSFTAILFGINFEVFGQGRLGIWIFLRRRRRLRC